MNKEEKKGVDTVKQPQRIDPREKPEKDKGTKERGEIQKKKV